MIGVLYISDSTYLPHTDATGYPVGYYGCIYDDTGASTPSKVKNKFAGTEIPNCAAIKNLVRGCIQSSDGVATTLQLILDIIAKYSLTSLNVIIHDPYMMMVASKWLPNWSTRAVKDNGQAVEHSELWVKVKDSCTHFIPQLETGEGNLVANIYSASRKPWATESMTTKPTLKPHPLLFLNNILHSTADLPTCMVHTSDLIDIGNMESSTTYGVMSIPLPEVVTDLITVPTDPLLTYVINMTTLTGFKGTLLANDGAKILHQPSKFDEVYTIGTEKNGTVIQPVTPVHKLYLAIDIYNMLTLVMRAVQLQVIDASLIKLVDITPDLFPNGVLLPRLQTRGNARVRLPLGKPRSLNVNSEIPHINALRAILKAKGTISAGYLNVNGIWRYLYVVQIGTEVGVYTTWLTKLYLP